MEAKLKVRIPQLREIKAKFDLIIKQLRMMKKVRGR